jgi:hypothetical protein
MKVTPGLLGETKANLSSMSQKALLRISPAFLSGLVLFHPLCPGHTMAFFALGTENLSFLEFAMAVYTSGTWHLLFLFLAMCYSQHCCMTLFRCDIPAVSMSPTP